MLAFAPKSSRVRERVKSWVWTLCECTGVSADVDGTDAIDPEVIELIVQLCTRIGMIMEDVGPLALNASREGLRARVAEIAVEIRAITAISNAAEALLQRGSLALSYRP
jgi:hypothetical protein